jgi:hypothetical protein
MYCARSIWWDSFTATHLKPFSCEIKSSSLVQVSGRREDSLADIGTGALEAEDTGRLDDEVVWRERKRAL